MKSKNSHPHTKSDYELLTLLEELAEDAYRSGETELAFCLAACAGAFARGIIPDISALFESVIGKAGRAGLLRKLADEAARSNTGQN